MAHGVATEDQLELVRKEAIGDEYVRVKELEKARLAEKGWILRTREALLGPVETVQESGSKGVLELVKDHESQDARVATAKAERQTQVSSVAAAAASSLPSATGPGQIDRLAENVAEAVTPSKKSSWTSWITGR